MVQAKARKAAANWSTSHMVYLQGFDLDATLLADNCKLLGEIIEKETSQRQRSLMNGGKPCYESVHHSLLLLREPSSLVPSLSMLVWTCTESQLQATF